jgi:hypothetical protein
LTVTGEKSFLVFSGGNDRAVIGFLRALRLCGARAHIVARTPDDQILRTDFRRDVEWVRPTHALSLDVFSESIQHVRASVGDGALVVLPSTEYFNTFLLRHRPEIEAMGCETPLVDASLYACLTQKATAVGFFSSAGLSVPREMQVPMIRDQPIVAKPFSNVSSNGRSLYPHLLDDRAQLEAFLARHDADEYFFQEYVHGDSLYLLFYLSKEEGHDFTWSQRNLLQQPNGKSMLLAEPSTFHESETAIRIVHALRRAGFHGLGMVEVIRTPDRDVFIEMNPRIWGPVQFCLDQGQVLLQAFIGEALHNDPQRYVDRRPRIRRNKYFWLGGLLETLGAGQGPAWHTAKRPLSLTIARNLACDIYLRNDSWRCFTHDLGQSFNWRTNQ